MRRSGTILTIENTQPLRVEYTVQCDREWETRSARIAIVHGGFGFPT